MYTTEDANIKRLCIQDIHFFGNPLALMRSIMYFQETVLKAFQKSIFSKIEGVLFLCKYVRNCLDSKNIFVIRRPCTKVV
jgi:hypothetical protein